MTDLRKIPVLVINAAYEPALITSARRAFVLLSKTDDNGNPIAVMEDMSECRINGGRWIIPSVIRLTRYRHVPRKTRDITRRGILARDQHTCMYCGKKGGAAGLTLDHIHPKSRGGQGSWENLVASCSPCNNRKANKTPEEAGMKLLRRPLPYTVFSSRFMLREAALNQPSWQRYLWYKNDTPQGEVIQ